MGIFDKLKKALTKTREGANYEEEKQDIEAVEELEVTTSEADGEEIIESVQIDSEKIVVESTTETPAESKQAPIKEKKKGPWGLANIFKIFHKVDEELFEELEESLIFADVGMETAMEIMDELREKVKDERIKEVSQTKEALKTIMVEHLEKCSMPEDKFPMVILMVGVNGVGKTTIIGKLSNKFIKEGKSVTLAAADTFRAAAVEQLTEWSNRSGANIIKSGEEGADPSAVVYDAIASAKSKNTDILIVDTAGRLHNKKNLMDELNKIKRTIDKNYSGANVQTYLALDATTGQNGVNQAEVFTQVADVDAVCLNKLDGTAKGGVVFGICGKIGIGVKYVGVGEGIDDLIEFDAKEFVDAIVD